MLVTIIADASYCHETGAAGYGYWVVCGRGRHIGSGSMKTPVANNNSAEMMALANALHQALGLQLIQPKDHVLLQSDCQAAIGGFIGNRHNITQEELGVAAYLKALVAKAGVTVSFRHVKGHTKGKTPRTWVNNNCDALAGLAMREARKKILQNKLIEGGDSRTKATTFDDSVTLA